MLSYQWANKPVDFICYSHLQDHQQHNRIVSGFKDKKVEMKLQ